MLHRREFRLSVTAGGVRALRVADPPGSGPRPRPASGCRSRHRRGTTYERHASPVHRGKAQRVLLNLDVLHALVRCRNNQGSPPEQVPEGSFELGISELKARLPELGGLDALARQEQLVGDLAEHQAGGRGWQGEDRRPVQYAS